MKKNFVPIPRTAVLYFEIYDALYMLLLDLIFPCPFILPLDMDLQHMLLLLLLHLQYRKEKVYPCDRRSAQLVLCL
ncbi:hypothetical protein L228DRAFT_122236 [Xylona heveae TC161]|uniref:Uncharacterized protein n=1 Tax=Xylona heveae (strain CBS 132557 / TC161) TaxID=1328760 RepID=A0A165HL42_XYLHT|nr:hypothetical protein L228DRAFT_122236 [Xylona heveae TC161]KZF23678.1 hypothetical protein L228DRAFT_122236 [Xylona heveae TC161]